LIFALLSSVVLANLQEQGYAVPHHDEDFGPVVRTGRYRVVHERILGGDSYAAPPDVPSTNVLAREDMHLDRPFIQGRHPSDVDPAGLDHYHYSGPMDGRKVYIYKRVHTPVRVSNGVVERLGPAQVVEKWAEGGYKNGHGQNVHVYTQNGPHVYSEDTVVPVKEGFFTRADQL
ncbi:hypothetical protein PENTCL1PPCAC_14034, partial [Pristionchus entomophagus]